MFYIKTLTNTIDRWLARRREQAKKLEEENDLLRRHYACGEKIHSFIEQMESAGVAHETLLKDFKMSEVDRFMFSYSYKFAVDDTVKIKVLVHFDDELADRLKKPRNTFFHDLTIFVNGQKCRLGIDDFEKMTKTILTKLYDRLIDFLESNNNAAKTWLINNQGNNKNKKQEKNDEIRTV